MTFIIGNIFFLIAFLCFGSFYLKEKQPYRAVFSFLFALFALINIVMKAV